MRWNIHAEWGASFMRGTLQHRVKTEWGRLSVAEQDYVKRTGSPILVFTAGNDMKNDVLAEDLDEKIGDFKKAWLSYGVKVLVVNVIPGKYQDLDGI